MQSQGEMNIAQSSRERRHPEYSIRQVCPEGGERRRKAEDQE